jgi:glycosyltransferase involved in cell wall biosynthesis
MRILLLSNFYPPAGRGGYERWCQEAAEGLRRSGHTVIVLTSRGGAAGPAEAAPSVEVRRELYLEMELASLAHAYHFFASRRRREAANLDTLRRLVESFRPQAILVWGMWNLPRSLPAEAERLLPGGVVYYMGDYWPTLPSQHRYYWDAPGKSWLTRLPKGLLRPLARAVLRGERLPPLRLERVLFPSRFMIEEFERRGVQVGCARLVVGAVDTVPFAVVGAKRQPRPAGLPRLLYAGRLAPIKGVDTVIQALARLLQPGLRLTIAGVDEDGYAAALMHLAAGLGVAGQVDFRGALPAAAMPALYAEHDIFVFPSIWQEPFGRVIVEAMAAGLAVVGAPTGGAAEILAGPGGDPTALTFPPGDASALASQLALLVDNPAQIARLAQAGRLWALERFDARRMAAQIEAELLALPAAPLPSV